MGCNLIHAAQPFNRRHFTAFGGHSQRQARVNPLTIDVYGTGPALTVVATFFSARQMQLFTQQIEQRYAWLNGEFLHRTVDVDLKRHLLNSSGHFFI